MMEIWSSDSSPWLILGAMLGSLSVGGMCTSTSSDISRIEQCAESCDEYAPIIEAGRCYCDTTKPTPRATPEATPQEGGR